MDARGAHRAVPARRSPPGAPGTAPGADPRTWFGPEDLPWLEQAGFEASDPFLRATPERQSLAAAFARDGYVVRRGLVPEALCAEVVEAVAPHFERTGAERLTNAAWALDPLRRLAALPEVLDLVAFLYGRRPIPFQTLNFRVGTEQADHRDEVHFDSLPPRFMCGVWVACEAIGPLQGPLRLVPGSHRSRSGDAVEAVTFEGEPGDVVIWSAAVLHGGSPVQREGSTRWSQVTHYFFEGGTYYTPMHSDPEEGWLELRRPLVDVASLRLAWPTLRGERTRVVWAGDGRGRLVPPGAPAPAGRWRQRWRAGRATARALIVPRLCRATRRPPP